MFKKPEVTVLMPTYNDSKYIRGSIESLLNQSFKKWELIIIDGSTDDTPEIVKQYADKRILYLREKKAVS
jgi:glycosyltransferase involved in cell wall biosynthesis